MIRGSVWRSRGVNAGSAVAGRGATMQANSFSGGTCEIVFVRCRSESSRAAASGDAGCCSGKKVAMTRTRLLWPDPPQSM